MESKFKIPAAPTRDDAIRKGLIDLYEKYGLGGYFLAAVKNFVYNKEWRTTLALQNKIWDEKYGALAEKE